MNKKIILLVLSIFFLTSCVSTSHYYVSDYPEYGHVETSTNALHVFDFALDIIVLISGVFASVFSSPLEINCCCHK